MTYNVNAYHESLVTNPCAFLSFDRSIHSKGLFPEVQKVVQEYFDQHHAEEVPLTDLEKPPDQVYYLPMHVVCKDSSTTTRVRAVFDASADTTTGVSLNSTLMVGPTVHPPLVDVLIRFRRHRIAMIAEAGCTEPCYSWSLIRTFTDSSGVMIPANRCVTTE